MNNARELQARLILEQCVNERRYAKIVCTDGSVAHLIPMGVSARLDDDGVPVWVSVGIDTDPLTRHESFCGVLLDTIATIEMLPEGWPDCQ